MSQNRTLVRSAAIAAGVVALAAGALIVAREESRVAESREISNLPRSGGKSFSSLDEYLAHLERLGGHDIPFYQKLPDGRYVRNLGRSASRTQTFYTRDELEKKFGFK